MRGGSGIDAAASLSTGNKSGIENGSGEINLRTDEVCDAEDWFVIDGRFDSWIWHNGGRAEGRADPEENHCV